jgi:phosphatidylglycerophosphate synthase
MPSLYDPEKMEKLPPNRRFFHISKVWYFSNRQIVQLLFSTPITPNQITWLSLFCSIISFCFFISTPENSLVFGGIFLYLKTLLDNVDGNLARVRGETSRLGRFFDSLVDFIATTLAYGGLTWRIVQASGDPGYWFLGIAAAISCFLHSTFFVYYLVSYTDRLGVYKNNRIDETITEKDRKDFKKDDYSISVHYLQLIHQLIYGWQDRLIKKLDELAQKVCGTTDFQYKRWYEDRLFLSFASLLSLCNNQFLLFVFTITDNIEAGFILIIGLGSSYLILLLIYKVLKQSIRVKKF